MFQPTPPRDNFFSDLGLSPKLLTALNRLRLINPTPIQRQAIPRALAGKDIIGVAQTGTGKTLAFALPLIQQIAAAKKQGLVILPTRELAMQVDEVFKKLGASLNLRTALIIGGSSVGRQVMAINRRPHVLIGTPGRINDLLNTHALNLKKVGVLVLDEADRMLDMGFAPQIKRIMQHVPPKRQTLLFSATMPAPIVKMASVYMTNPVRIAIAQTGTVADHVDQELFLVQREQKNNLLDKLLKDYTGTVLVFARTKYGAKKICRAVRGRGHTVTEIHSNLSLSQRRRSLDGFKSGKFRVLVATDIASRGIDVTNIELVINYDLPDNPDDYVHRVGRTGRAGQGGRAISFMTSEQRGKVRLIERLVRQSLRISPLPQLPAVMPRIAYQPRSRNHQAVRVHR
ncbi:MAG: DEAD/DEAH box helicase [Candidatus Andersenbacteria bacterium]|nr:DEAD/DEAH box helicase [Candidatus Andersenbacteria bacterium]